MPKKFSDNEKEYIVNKLKEEAKKCLIKYGIKKTTVDELVKRVNIPKGTFYLFYESKELLFFDVINDMHDSIQKKLIEDMATISGNITPELVTELITKIYHEVNDTGLLSIMLSGELEFLMRKLPEEKVKEHLVQDDFSMEQLIRFLPVRKDINVEAFSGAFRGIFMTLLYKREIGEEIFGEALKIMIHGVVIQLMED